MDVHQKSLLVEAKSQGLVTVVNYLGNKRVGERRMNPDNEITAVNFSPDGKLLSYGTRKDHVWLLDGATLEKIRMMPFS